MDDEPLDEPLRSLARSYHEPPATPREHMWHSIRRGRKRERVVPLRRWIPIAAAASLVLGAGIGIGRMSRDSTPPIMAAPASANAPAYRLATLEHLSQSEEFLTLFRASLGGGDHRLASATARRLLGTNRLLLDSPAAVDRRTRLLLEDLELVLAGIAQLSEDVRTQDLELITETMERGSVMPRLRSAVPSGAGFSQGAL